MAQRYKGRRKQIAIEPHLMTDAVKQVIARRAAQRAMGFSQYVADLLALAVGRPDRALELPQQALDQMVSDAVEVEPPVNVAPRVDEEVYALIRAACAAGGVSMASYTRAVCEAHAADHELPALPRPEEVLLLTG